MYCCCVGLNWSSGKITEKREAEGECVVGLKHIVTCISQVQMVELMY